MRVADKSIDEFLNDIATKPCTPAGGCIAALCAASSIALMEMVARHTVHNKKKSMDVVDCMEEVAKISLEYRKSFLDYMDIDTKAYKDVINAQKNKEENLEEYHKISVNIPLEMASKLFNLINIIRKVIEDGSEILVTDGVAALLMAKVTIICLIYHTKFNLIYIKDKNFVDKITAELELMEKRLS